MASFKDVVQLKRECFKAAFPEYKFSIRMPHYGSVHVSVLEGPKQLIESGYEQINYYHPKNGAISEEAGEILKNMSDILMNGNYTVHTDQDYGNIPNFYVHLEVGKWDRPYKLINGAGAFIIKKTKEYHRKDYK